MIKKHGVTWDADGAPRLCSGRQQQRACHTGSRLQIKVILLHMLLLATMLAGCVTPMSSMRVSQAATADLATQKASHEVGLKLQPYLSTLASLDPTDPVRVIVQYQGTATTFLEELVLAKGSVVKELSLINALVVTIPAGNLPGLSNHESVRWISIDAPVRKSNATDGSGYNARDDFDQVSFSGSSGALPWSTDWVEIGESDGAAAGNVLVTTFWGGALQGMRLQNAQVGAMRGVDIGVAEEVALGLAYRRKDFAKEGDYVTIEASQDGGSTWREVTRLAGTVTDPAIQYGDFAVPILTGDRTAGEKLLLRFLTAPSMSADATLYIDAVDLRLGMGQTAAENKATQIYLPLIAGGGGLAQDAAQPTTRTKPEELATIHAASESCTYHCFDLNALQSTYIKAIGADRLWNTPPYIRGWDVTVAVVDSGIAPHPDLNDYNGNSRLLARVNFVANSDVPDDFYGHGTHIAGTIAGLGISSNGAYMGVAPEARLVDVKVTDDYGMGNTSDVVAGLQWIYDNRSRYNIKIANLSLNSTVPESYHVSALDAALEVLWFNQITVVVSAGNEGKEKLYPPANDPFAIVVGSADDQGTTSIADDKLSSFSAYGMTTDGFIKPDLVAPGQNIISLLASDDMNLKKALPLNSILGNNNKYFKMSGTSMASAVMAGAVALLLEDEPTLSPDQVKYRLATAAQPFAVTQGTCSTGAGYLDIYAAVRGNSTHNANTGLQASQMLWSGTNPVTWGSVSWNSVSWNSVSWNSVSWNSVSWNSVSWNSVSWNSNSSGNGNSNTDCATVFTDITLVNAQTGKDIQPLYENAVIDLDSVGTNNLTVRADVIGPVGSVKFEVAERNYVKVENVAPYAQYGDSNGNYGGTQFYPGTSQTKVSAYANDNAGGNLLASQEYQVYYISSNYTPKLQAVHSNLCIQPPYQSWSSGEQQEQTYCSWSSAQKYRIKPVAGQKDIVNIVNVQNNLCLDINGASNSDGAAVIQWGCHANQNQQFRLKGTGNGTFNLIPVHSGKCITVKNRSTWIGADLVQETCQADATNQQWRFN